MSRRAVHALLFLLGVGTTAQAQIQPQSPSKMTGDTAFSDTVTVLKNDVEDLDRRSQEQRKQLEQMNQELQQHKTQVKGLLETMNDKLNHLHEELKELNGDLQKRNAGQVEKPQAVAPQKVPTPSP